MIRARNPWNQFFVHSAKGTPAEIDEVIDAILTQEEGTNEMALYTRPEAEDREREFDRRMLIRDERAAYLDYAEARGFSDAHITAQMQRIK